MKFAVEPEAVEEAAVDFLRLCFNENIGNAPLPALVGIIAAMAEVWANECGPARRFRNCSSLASIEHRRFSFITGNWRRLNIQHLSKSL
jgi:hypothetical protein